MKNHVDSNDQNNYDYKRTPPVMRTGWAKLWIFLYNPEEGKLFDKTAKQWGITGLFYLCFLSALTLLFAVCMAGLMATMDKHKPRYTLDSSLIGSSPGLGFRPISENSKELALIVYKTSNETQIQEWIDRVDKFLEVYINRSSITGAGNNQKICSYTQPNIKPGYVCKVDLDKFGPCAPGSDYGFKNSAPCVFIKLNKIIDWVPDYYTKDSQFPDNMPSQLVEHIKSQNQSELNTVWVSCSGENSADDQSIGEIDYFPEIQGFPGYYYPYKHDSNYLSPLVAVRFRRPKRNQIINVECRAWAKNIKHDKKDKLGMVHFEILIDE